MDHLVFKVKMVYPEHQEPGETVDKREVPDQQDQKVSMESSANVDYPDAEAHKDRLDLQDQWELQAPQEMKGNKDQMVPLVTEE